jgi:hypothetical protein
MGVSIFVEIEKRAGMTAEYVTTSLRGALAPKQSRLSPWRDSGLLRGACHPAALRADRVARNDVVAVSTVVARLDRATQYSRDGSA